MNWDASVCGDIKGRLSSSLVKAKPLDRWVEFAVELTYDPARECHLRQGGTETP